MFIDWEKMLTQHVSGVKATEANLQDYGEILSYLVDI